MIIDNLTNLTKYVALNRSFQTVIDYLKANDLKSMEPGHYPIDGDNIFVNIQEGFGKTKDEAKVECHHDRHTDSFDRSGDIRIHRYYPQRC